MFAPSRIVSGTRTRPSSTLDPLDRHHRVGARGHGRARSRSGSPRPARAPRRGVPRARLAHDRELGRRPGDRRRTRPSPTSRTAAGPRRSRRPRPARGRARRRAPRPRPAAVATAASTALRASSIEISGTRTILPRGVRRRSHCHFPVRAPREARVADLLTEAPTQNPSDGRRAPVPTWTPRSLDSRKRAATSPRRG